MFVGVIALAGEWTRQLKAHALVLHCSCTCVDGTYTAESALEQRCASHVVHCNGMVLIVHENEDRLMVTSTGQWSDARSALRNKVASSCRIRLPGDGDSSQSTSH